MGMRRSISALGFGLGSGVGLPWCLVLIPFPASFFFLFHFLHLPFHLVVPVDLGRVAISLPFMAKDSSSQQHHPRFGHCYITR